MIFNIIIGVVVAGSLGVVVFLIIKSFPKLSRIDTSTISSEKQAEVKSSLMEERLERKFKQAGGLVEKVFKPVFNVIFESLTKFREIIKTRAKHYAERSKAKKEPSLEDRENIRQKVNKLFTEAEEFYKNEDWSEAEKKYLEIISLDMKNIEAYEKLGWAYFEMKDHEHAKETFEFIKKINPKDSEIYYGLGKICLELDKKEEALINFKEAVMLSPNNPKTLDALLDTAITLKDKYLANSTYDKLKQVNPENQKLEELKNRIIELEK